MIVTDIREISKNKFKVYMDYEYQFILYSKDIHKYGIKVNVDITEELYNKIINETIFYRAKRKALNILMRMDRTEYELRNKLKEAGYNEDIISRTLDYIYSYRYLDDNKYVDNYIKQNKYAKSKRQIEFNLIQKGIDKTVINQYFEINYNDEEQGEDPEVIAIKKEILKKTNDVESLDFSQKQKLLSYLYRKGFRMDKVNHVIRYYE